MTTRRRDDKWLQWWPVIVTAVTMLCAAGMTYGTVKDHDKRINALEAAKAEHALEDVAIAKELSVYQRDQALKLSGIQSDLSGIHSDVTWIVRTMGKPETNPPTRSAK